MYGNLLFRLRRLDEARSAYEDALTTLHKVDHFYRDTFIAQTHCGLGDVEHARRNYDEALRHYGNAVDFASANPVRTAMGFLQVRASAGMGKAFYCMAVNREAREKIQNARDTLERKEGYSFNWAWECCDAQSYFDLASAYAELHQRKDAVEFLLKALRIGWRDSPQIKADENLGLLQNDPRLDEALTALRATSPLP